MSQPTLGAGVTEKGTVGGVDHVLFLSRGLKDDSVQEEHFLIGEVRKSLSIVLQRFIRFIHQVERAQ